VTVAGREQAVLLLTVTFTDSAHSFTQPHQQPAAVKKNFFAGVRYQQQRTTPGYCKVSTEQSNSPPLLVSRAKSRARTEAVKATGFAHPLGFPPQNGKTLAKKNNRETSPITATDRRMAPPNNPRPPEPHQPIRATQAPPERQKHRQAHINPNTRRAMDGGAGVTYRLDPRHRQELERAASATPGVSVIPRGALCSPPARASRPGDRKRSAAGDVKEGVVVNRSPAVRNWFGFFCVCVGLIGG
jgi:hypothetical protein